MKPIARTNDRAVQWEKKLKLFKALLDVNTDSQFVNAVVAGAGWVSRDIESIEGRLPKWKEGTRPTQDPASRFFSLLADKLPTRDTVNGQLLIELPIEDYVERLPQKDEKVSAVLRLHGFSRVDRPSMNAPSTSPISPMGLSRSQAFDADSLYLLWNHDRGPEETIQVGFQKGKIDQRHYYIDPDSAHTWSALVRADAYPTYGHCKTALEALVNSSEWISVLNSEKPHTLVMLAGGGAPTKDLVLVQSLLGQPYIRERVALHLVDISWFMLTNSRRSINEHAQLL
jgi:hypothetical protein